jgi:hypothetical protein
MDISEKKEHHDLLESEKRQWSMSATMWARQSHNWSKRKALQPRHYQVECVRALFEAWLFAQAASAFGMEDEWRQLTTAQTTTQYAPTGLVEVLLDGVVFNAKDVRNNKLVQDAKIDTHKLRIGKAALVGGVVAARMADGMPRGAEAFRRRTAVLQTLERNIAGAVPY